MGILDKFSLLGKLAVVTGGTKGIGKGICIGLAEAGADIVSVSRSPLPELESIVLETGRQYSHIPADLTSREDVLSIMPAIIDKIGPPDVLVNNAGICPRNICEDFSDEDWDRTLEINLSAYFILSRDAAKVMLRKKSGKIINIASVLAFQGGMNIPSYAASKHGVVGLTKSFASAWSSRGINVNAIAPGYIATEFISALMDDPVRSKNLLSRVPAGRWGEIEDIAGAAVFLASPASEFIHGAVLPVDGGWLAL